MKRLERLLSLRRKKEDVAARSVAEQQRNLESAQSRMKDLVEQRTQPLNEAQRLEAFRMTGAWTAEEIEGAHLQMLSTSSDLDKARAALATVRNERKVMQEQVDRARSAAALVASRVAQSAADELALTRRMYVERMKNAE
jgi:flagellar biosynthesis chaperone FliJ